MTLRYTRAKKSYYFQQHLTEIEQDEVVGLVLGLLNRFDHSHVIISSGKDGQKKLIVPVEKLMQFIRR
jgi:hypothetical protein